MHTENICHPCGRRGIRLNNFNLSPRNIYDNNAKHLSNADVDGGEVYHANIKELLE